MRWRHLIQIHGNGKREEKILMRSFHASGPEGLCLRTVANSTDVKKIIVEALLKIVPSATDITIEKAQKLFTGTWSAVATYTLGDEKRRSRWFIDKEGNSQLVDTTTLGPLR